MADMFDMGVFQIDYMHPDQQRCATYLGTDLLELVLIEAYQDPQPPDKLDFLVWLPTFSSLSSAEMVLLSIPDFICQVHPLFVTLTTPPSPSGGSGGDANLPHPTAYLSPNPSLIKDKDDDYDGSTSVVTNQIQHSPWL